MIKCANVSYMYNDKTTNGLVNSYSWFNLSVHIEQSIQLCVSIVKAKKLKHMPLPLSLLLYLSPNRFSGTRIQKMLRTQFCGWQKEMNTNVEKNIYKVASMENKNTFSLVKWCSIFHTKHTLQFQFFLPPFVK